MRSFEERKKEIMLRSEQKIQKNKKRKRIIYTVTPCLVLMLVIGGLLLKEIPLDVNHDKTDELLPEDMAQNFAPFDTFFAGTANTTYFTVSDSYGNGVVEYHTASEVSYLTSLIDVLSKRDTETQPSNDITNEKDQVQETACQDVLEEPKFEAAPEAQQYSKIINVFYEDGTNKSFEYDGYNLIDSSNGQSYVLSLEDVGTLNQIIYQKEMK